MTAATDTLEGKILDLIAPGGTAYVSLHAADPGEDGTKSPEVSGGAYARKQATFTVSGNTLSLSQTVTWEGMPAVTVGGMGVWDALTGGKMLVHLALAQAKTVTAGDSLVVSTGNLTISAD